MADKKLKTIKGWVEHGGSWGEYCKPGELVDEDVYWYFLEALPPRSMGFGYLQMGEPHDCRMDPDTGKFRSTYMTFAQVEKGVWKYCGNCFAGQDKEVEKR